VTDEEMKVTDKRMFTPDGELKEEFQHLDEARAEDSAAPRREVEEEPGASRQEPTQPVEPEVSPVASEAPPVAEPEEGRGRVEIPLGDEGLGELSFLDLVGLVAQPVAIYLGDAKLPGDESAENLDMARLHIDLLEVLKTKTAGNLTAQEHTFLEDLLYQLRLRYVQKRG
jgi:hypothetical protein